MCVLLVEDEPLILECMAETFSEAGYEVATAVDGASAIALIEGSEFVLSALVTDYHLPGGFDGPEVIARMRRRYPVVPIVIATARRELLTIEWQRKHQAEVLRKPYSMATLLAMFQRLSPLTPIKRAAV